MAKCNVSLSKYTLSNAFERSTYYGVLKYIRYFRFANEFSRQEVHSYVRDAVLPNVLHSEGQPATRHDVSTHDASTYDTTAITSTSITTF